MKVHNLVSVQKQRFTPDTSLLFWYLFVLESMNVFCDTCTFISFSGLALWLECLSRLIVWCLYNLKAGVLALLNASVVWLSKIIYPHCSVLVGSRNWFKHVLNKLWSSSCLKLQLCKVLSILVLQGVVLMRNKNRRTERWMDGQGDFYLHTHKKGKVS